MTMNSMITMVSTVLVMLTIGASFIIAGNIMSLSDGWLNDKEYKPPTHIRIISGVYIVMGILVCILSVLFVIGVV